MKDFKKHLAANLGTTPKAWTRKEARQQAQNGNAYAKPTSPNWDSIRVSALQEKGS